MAGRKISSFQPKIKDLPEGMRVLALLCQFEQGNKPDDEVYLVDHREIGNFCWHSTTQGEMFWNKVYSDVIESASKANNK